MRIDLRISFVGLVSLAGAAVACGSTAFSSGDTPDDSGPGTDSRTGDDARRADGPATHDAAGDSPTSPDAGADGNLPPSIDASLDAPADARADSPADGTTPEDGGGRSDGGTTCATKTTNDGTGVFLVSGGSGTGCQRYTPCGTLENAIVALGTHAGKPGGKSIVFVGPGTFVLATSVAVPDGVTIQGGWNISNSNTWTGSCDAGDTPDFTAAAPQVLTVGSAATPSNGTVTLDTVNVTNALTAAPGQSVYGVFAVGSASSSLTLNDVNITVPAGGDGTSGADGSQGNPGAAGGCGAASGGSAGTALSPVGSSYSDTGFGTRAATASQAGTGAVGATPAPLVTCAPSTDGDGTSNDGNPTTCVQEEQGGVEACVGESYVFTCTPPVNSGCGGTGGTGGFAGGGGGSSIALFAWSENITITAGTFTSGRGGQGGTGGTGGTGGAGAAAGAAGGATAPYISGCTGRVAPCAPGHPCTPTYECLLDDATLTALPGSPGGQGGTGGQGAGGAGGDSYAYYVGPVGAPGAISTHGTFVPTTGPAGPAGSPGGVAGHAGTTNTAD